MADGTCSLFESGASCAAAGERVWQYGGSGTPEIPEFGVCEVASALGMSPNGAGIFVGDILDIRYRLPRLDAALHRGQVDAWRVRKVASATRESTIAQAAEADRRLSAETLGDGTPMLGRVSMARLRPYISGGGGLAALNGLISAEDGAADDVEEEAPAGDTSAHEQRPGREAADGEIPAAFRREPPRRRRPPSICIWTARRRRGRWTASDRSPARRPPTSSGTRT